MHKSSLSLNDYGVFPLESDMQGNLPVSFGKGATEKGWKAPRRCPTSFRHQPSSVPQTTQPVEKPFHKTHQ